MKRSLLAIALLSCPAFAASPAATTPFDVVLPSLNGDPASDNRVVGQMYQDISGNAFKVVDESGGVKTFVMSGDVDQPWQHSGSDVYYDAGSVGIGGAPAGGNSPGLQVFAGDGGDALLVRAGTTGTKGGITMKPEFASGMASIQGVPSDLSATAHLALQPEGGSLVISKSGELTHIQGNVRMSAFGAGTCTFDSSGNVSSSSDERLKSDIVPFEKGLSVLRKINPISYRWNEISGLETKNQYVGFSAQNVQAALPEGVGMSSKGYLSLQERAIIATLVNAVKELEAEVKALKAQKK